MTGVQTCALPILTEGIQAAVCTDGSSKPKHKGKGVGGSGPAACPRLQAGNATRTCPADSAQTLGAPPGPRPGEGGLGELRAEGGAGPTLHRVRLCPPKEGMGSVHVEAHTAMADAQRGPQGALVPLPLGGQFLGRWKRWPVLSEIRNCQVY